MYVLLAAEIFCVLFVASAVIVGIRRIRKWRLSRVEIVSYKDLIERSLISVKSLEDEMEALEEIFRPAAYAGVMTIKQIAWSGDVREGLQERIQAAKEYLCRMNKNVINFGQMGERGVLFSMGEDAFALEIATKAKGCKFELDQVRRRIVIYDMVPVLLWRFLGRKFALDCLYGGSDLIEQYRLLAERVLVFVRARGDDYHYETLLSAL